MAGTQVGVTNLRVAILGCGALGGVMAARLADAGGCQLEVYNTNPQIAEAIEGRGLALVEGSRRTVRPVRILPPPAGGGRTDDGLDVVILATKSVGLVEAAGGLLPALADDGIFVTTQNGLVALDLAEAFGSPRVVAGAVLWGASMDAPGVYRITAHGPLVLGAPEPFGVSLGVERAAAVLSAVSPVRRCDNMPGVLWSKLAITASLTTLGAITDLRFGELVRQRRTRRVLLGLGAEVLAVARARGISLEPLTGGLNIERFLSEDGYPPPVKHLLMRILGWKHRHTESSLLDSLRRGRTTESEFINGRVVRLGEESGVPCPLNRRAVEVVQAMEAGRLRPGVDQIEGFAVGLER